MQELSAITGMPLEEIRARSEYLWESNPMLGHRGCRLGITYPEIYEMQARAIAEAALKCHDTELDVQIMVPLVATMGEMKILHEMISRTVKDACDAAKVPLIKYKIGSMLEGL